MNVGDRISCDVGGCIETHTVTSVRYKSGTAEIYRQPSWWEVLLPRRFRKPLLVRPAELPSVTVGFDEADTPISRTMKTFSEMKALIGGFDK